MTKEFKIIARQAGAKDRVALMSREDAKMIHELLQEKCRTLFQAANESADNTLMDAHAEARRLRDRIGYIVGAA